MAAQNHLLFEALIAEVHLYFREGNKEQTGFESGGNLGGDQAVISG